jgi:hypothetical protein
MLGIMNGVKAGDCGATGDLEWRGRVSGIATRVELRKEINSSGCHIWANRRAYSLLYVRG